MNFILEKNNINKFNEINKNSLKTFNNISVTGFRHAIIHINHKFRTHLKQTNLFSLKNTSLFTKHVLKRQYDPPPSKKIFKPASQIELA